MIKNIDKISPQARSYLFEDADVLEKKPTLLGLILHQYQKSKDKRSFVSNQTNKHRSLDKGSP